VTKGECTPLASGKVTRRTAIADVAELLDSPEVAALIAALAPQGRGRKGFGPRSLVGACLVKALFALPTCTRVAALIASIPACKRLLRALRVPRPATGSRSSCARTNLRLPTVSTASPSRSKRRCRSTERTSPLTRATFLRSRMDSGTSTTAARSANGSPTQTHLGATAPQSPPAPQARSTATRFMPRFVPVLTSRSHGGSRRHAGMSLCLSRRSWMPLALAVSARRRSQWTRATTTIA
jgi:hypothetical protein